jgi:hypothetical protein
MGYESKIYIVRKSGYFRRDEEKQWAEDLAIIDMSKCYELSSILCKKPATDCFIYSDDGNTRIEEDRYGSPLTETPLHEALQIVEDVIAKTPYDYWMYSVLRSTLQSIYDFVGDDENFVVLHYGY